MSASIAPQRTPSTLTAGQLPRWATPATVTASVVVGIVVASLLGEFNLGLAALFAFVLYQVITFVTGVVAEGPRKATDRLMQGFVVGAFLLALVPLLWLASSTLAAGLNRFDPTFFSYSMRNVVGEGGGAVHAIYGTLAITGVATLISVPVGLLTAVYLSEYGQGKALARGITFFVDVMTGIPSIVAGLFAYALMGLVFRPGFVSGFSGSIALSVLMIPVVVRACEELLRIVPNELREASYALGVPKWRTILKIVIPTAISGLVSGVILAIARIIGETALMIAAGFTQSVNNNFFADPMMTLPTFVYGQYAYRSVPQSAYVDRAWAGALTLILIVMALNLIGRLIAKRFAPKTGR